MKLNFLKVLLCLILAILGRNLKTTENFIEGDWSGSVFLLKFPINKNISTENIKNQFKVRNNEVIIGFIPLSLSKISMNCVDFNNLPCKIENFLEFENNEELIKEEQIQIFLNKTNLTNSESCFVLQAKKEESNDFINYLICSSTVDASLRIRIAVKNKL